MMEKCIPIVNRKHLRKLPVSDVCYIQQEGRKVLIETTEGSYTMYAKIKEFEDYVRDEGFVYVLKYTLVNLNQISRMGEQMIEMWNGKKIMLGKENYVRAKQIFAIYLKNPCMIEEYVV